MAYNLNLSPLFDKISEEFINASNNFDELFGYIYKKEDEKENKEMFDPLNLPFEEKN